MSSPYYQADNAVFCLTCSVHSCGIVQDVHRHGPVTSEANSKLYIFMVVL